MWYVVLNFLVKTCPEVNFSCGGKKAVGHDCGENVARKRWGVRQSLKISSGGSSMSYFTK